jgi:hypothetical protein
MPYADARCHVEGPPTNSATGKPVKFIADKTIGAEEKAIFRKSDY